MFSKAFNLLWLARSLLVSAQAVCTPAVPVDHTGDFPPGNEIENIAIRPSGSILANSYTIPQIFEIEPKVNATPKVIATFENTRGVDCIVESSTPDVYFVITGNFSFETFSPTNGSYAIHRLSFSSSSKPTTKLLARLPISQPNGMTHIPHTPFVLIADTRGGLIYRFNTQTLSLTTYFDNPLLKATDLGTGIFFGVNGIKLSGGYLYFSNTNQQLIARIAATGLERSLTGAPEIVVTGAPADDFILDDFTGDIYFTANGNANLLGLKRGTATDTTFETLVGGPNCTDLLFPTAARWVKGEEGRTLLVTSSGAIQLSPTPAFVGGGNINIVHV